MADAIIPTEIENSAEDARLVTVSSFDELLGCSHTAYDVDDNVLIIDLVRLDFEIDSKFFTKIKETYSEIVTLRFYDCSFLHSVIARSSTIEYSLDFTDSKFEGEANFEFANFGGEASFQYAKFGGEANFLDVKFGGKADFWGTKFEGEANFLGAKFGGKANFWDTKFGGEANFWSAKFGGEADFRGAKFGGEVDFRGACFELRVTMDRIDINSKMVFTGAKFNSGISFSGSNFNSTILFDEIVFSTENNTNELLFNGCYFNSDSAVIFQNIAKQNYNIVIENTTIRGAVIMRDIKANSLSLRDSVVIGTVSLADNAVFKKTLGRRTDCILKHEALKINDIVGYLKYRKDEHIKICEELFGQNKKARGRAERWVVRLNHISNDSGQSWGRGVLFTLGSAFGFYSLFLCSIYFAGVEGDWDFINSGFWTTYITNTLEYVWPLDGLAELSELKIKYVNVCFLNCLLLALGKILFISGKIAVGFGIYQTIAAFRRHGK